MVIRALDHVRQCYTAADGAIIRRAIAQQLAQGRSVRLSFDGVYDVPSSFVNGAIVELLDEFQADYIKSHLTIVDATRQIADMVRRCLANGIRRNDPPVAKRA